jgi:hypothetical protein
MARKKAPLATYNAIEGTVCRALYQHHAGMLNNLEFKFETEEGPIIVVMPFEVARETLNEGIAAYQTIMQPLRIARQVPFGG